MDSCLSLNYSTPHINQHCIMIPNLQERDVSCHMPNTTSTPINSLEMDTHEKQPRGSLGACISGAGIRRLEPDLAACSRQPSKAVSWSCGLRRSFSLGEIQAYAGGGQRSEEAKDFVEARKSVSHVEANISTVASSLQVKVLVADMPAFMQVHAFRCARRTYDSLQKFSSKHMAYNLKKEFDGVYGPAWHCIVGSSFGSFVTHSTGYFLYFSMEKIFVLVYRTKVQRAVD
ncbi:PREDICTED: uncharacterized protein LOC104595354 [Nelumbo nucifera]|uniref:Uncharacterized protein LOC104595354 n=1 Tax=Nelumbo nucifera TaxID=4432 RepID=A0A1U8Q4D7_NELNU|nr:PREDICTED: uncharacterized protein LOC104595354 [Nelumbo nucifera]